MGLAEFQDHAQGEGAVFCGEGADAFVALCDAVDAFDAEAVTGSARDRYVVFYLNFAAVWVLNGNEQIVHMCSDVDANPSAAIRAF